MSCFAFRNGHCVPPGEECAPGEAIRLWDTGCENAQDKCCTTEPQRCIDYQGGHCVPPDEQCATGETSKRWDIGCENDLDKCCTTEPVN